MPPHALDAYVAARSGHASTTFTPAQSAAVNITLFRQYLRGEISEAEWEHWKRQPHISGWPLNVRPYLEWAWFERGGGEFVLSIGLFYHQLPSMCWPRSVERCAAGSCIVQGW